MKHISAKTKFSCIMTELALSISINKAESNLLSFKMLYKYFSFANANIKCFDNMTRSSLYWCKRYTRKL